MSDKPKNGDMIKCDRCRACHRVSTPVIRETGQLILGTLVFNCAGSLRIAYTGGVVRDGIKFVKPVGVNALASEDHAPRDKGLSRAKGINPRSQSKGGQS